MKGRMKSAGTISNDTAAIELRGPARSACMWGGWLDDNPRGGRGYRFPLGPRAQSADSFGKAVFRRSVVTATTLKVRHTERAAERGKG